MSSCDNINYKKQKYLNLKQLGGVNSNEPLTNETIFEAVKEYYQGSKSFARVLNSFSNTF